MNKSDNALNIQNRDTPDYEETLSTCRDRIRQNNKTPTTITPYTISPSISEKDITEKAPPTSEPDISEPGIQQFDLMDFMNTNDSCLDSILSDFLSEEQTDTCQIPDPLPPQNSSENGSGTSLSELNPFDSNSAITPTSQNNLLIQEILNLRHGLAQSEYHCETLKAENLMLSQENSTLRMKNSETIQRHKASCKTIEYAANKLKIGSLEVQRDKKRLEQTVNQREIEISTLKKKLTDKKNVNKILRANIGSTASSQKSTDQSQTTALIDKCKQLFDMLGVQCPDTDSASLTKAIDSSLAVVEQYNIENKSSIDQLKQSSAVRIEPLTKDSLILLLANSKVNIMTITRFLEHSNKLFKKIVNDEKDCVNHLGSTIESLNRQLTSGQIKTNNALGTLKLFESYHEKIKGLQKIKTDLITDNYTTLTAVKNAKINDCEIYQGIINKNNSSSLKRKIETPESTLGIKYLKTL
ncbi:hypothetical protein, partial [Endozoicomonas sp.]|uniref:hypothetical protein n=1 Tax=Endozoicomonas sp. TaxID=1892382 RepID=UPI00383B1399